jgi:hypothetical protein
MQSLFSKIVVPVWLEAKAHREAIFEVSHLTWGIVFLKGL